MERKNSIHMESVSRDNEKKNRCYNALTIIERKYILRHSNNLQVKLSLPLNKAKNKAFHSNEYLILC